jgi:peptidyl-prolyl cis-trans isomerase C
MHRWLIVAAAVLALGCKSKSESNSKGSVGAQTVLARVDDVVITTKDMKDLLSRYASRPFVLARYSSIEKKKELLDSLIRYDVLAIEALRRGYQRDPEVQRVAKERMVRLFTQQEIVDKVKPSDVTEDEVKKFYAAHASDFVRPEAVRVSQILVKDRAKAQKVLAVAKALPKGDQKAFRDLVAKESEDPDSKQRGGDLTQFDRSSTLFPSPVVAAAFALKDIGDLSDLVTTHKGYVILKLTDRRPAQSRSLDDARLEIQRRLLEEMRAKKKQELVAQARRTIKVEVDEDALAKLDLAAMPAETGGTKTAGSPSLPATGRSLDAGAMVGSRP